MSLRVSKSKDMGLRLGKLEVLGKGHLKLLVSGGLDVMDSGDQSKGSGILGWFEKLGI